MSVLEVCELRKTYSGFCLDGVSFSLEQGKITGFIGRNGAGKSTTLKSLFGFVHPDSGEVKFFGKSFGEDESGIKQRTGFVLGEVNYYSNKRLSSIANVTKKFYPSWDDVLYKKYMTLFSLDENKKPSELSSGMKVKFSIVLALSHGAELLILDEPTSGLDPVSRDELTGIFIELCREGKTILFSTHITSDLERCADRIIYIKKGKIIADDDIKAFQNGMKTVHLSEKPSCLDGKLIGKKVEKEGLSALIRSSDVPDGIECTGATLEDIMVHFEREDSI